MPTAEPAPFPLDATIPELQAAMEEGRTTALDLVNLYLARIAAYDSSGPRLNAFITVNPKARDEAAALDAERAESGARGPLHGIPLVLKDNINTVDMPTTAGTRTLEGFLPGDDAFQVRRLREAGAIIIGKANLFEYARGWETRSSLGGQTLNPYDLERDPGGSSGGTAVAVTANFAVAGLGTDTCGSVRLPAAHSNLYGLRPTGGLSSRTGVIPLSPTLDTVGPMTRSVIDLAILLAATAGIDADDPTTVPVEASYVAAVQPDGLQGRRIGVVSRWFTDVQEVFALFSTALDDMATHGAELIEIELPTKPREADLGTFIDEAQPALADYVASYPHAPLRATASWSLLDHDRYRGALATREPFRAAIVALMDEHDLDAIAYPASSSTAARIGGSQHPLDCFSAALGGLPALALPVGFVADGLPVGLELMGRPFAEETLIAIAAGYEAHTDHRRLPPTTPPLP
jgi:amidase